MELHQNNNRLIKVILVFILLIYFLYNIPFISRLSFSLESLKNIFQSQDGLQTPLLRSLTFAFIQAVLLTSLGLIFSLALFKIPIYSQSGKLLSLLLVPILLGNVAIAFIFKIILFDANALFQNENIKFLTLSFIQIWQFGSLFIYLFWLNQQTIPQSVWNYANAAHFNTYEKIKDVILPKQRNLSLLLFILAFVFSYYEDAKIQFIFRASRGTNTELVNQWLNRKFQSDSLINADFGFANISQSASIVIIFAVIGLILTLILKNKLFYSFIRSERTVNFKIPFSSLIGKITTFCLVMLIIIPIVFVIIIQSGNFQFHFQSLIMPLWLTLFASISASFISILFGILSRLAWQRLLADFNRGSMTYLIAIFMLILIPPIVLLITGFKWMQNIGYSTPNTIYLAWIIGHIFLSFPLLSGFAIATHFRVKNNIINYLQSHQLTLMERIRDLFIKPFKADYLLTFIIAFALIWNESTINSVLSDVIPSFVTILNRTISGKAADYANGMNYLFISFVLAIISVGIWNYSIIRFQKLSEE